MAVLTALARMYCGDWVADCPRPGCTNTELLSPGQWTFFCGSYARGKGQDLSSYCQWEGQITWPGNVYDIHAELQRRPVRTTRNWFPAAYPRERVMASTPLGQTPAQLADEFMKNDPIAAEQR